MIEWRLFKGDRPSPVFSVMQVFIDDWKACNPASRDLDGMDIMVAMNMVDPRDISKMRLDRVEVQWKDKEGRDLEEVDTIIKKPSRSERRRVEREYLKDLAKKNKGWQTLVDSAI